MPGFIPPRPNEEFRRKESVTYLLWSASDGQLSEISTKLHTGSQVTIGHGDEEVEFWSLVQLSSIAELPNVAAVYALFGGQGPRLYVAYVGIARKLKQRVTQHLINRDSSVTTGTSAARINPDYITQVGWWEHPRFQEASSLM